MTPTHPEDVTIGAWKHIANLHNGVESGGWHEIRDSAGVLIQTLVSPFAGSGADDSETYAKAEKIVADHNSALEAPSHERK